MRDKRSIEVGWLLAGSSSTWGRRVYYPEEQYQIVGRGPASTPRSSSLPPTQSCLFPRLPARTRSLHLRYPLPWGSRRANGHVQGHKTSSRIHGGLGMGWKKIRPPGKLHTHFGHEEGGHP